MVSEAVVFSGFGGEVAVDRRKYASGSGTLREVLGRAGGVHALIDVAPLSESVRAQLHATPIWRSARWLDSWEAVCARHGQDAVGLPVAEAWTLNGTKRLSYKGIVIQYDTHRDEYAVEYEDGEKYARNRTALLQTVLVAGEPEVMMQLGRVMGDRSLHPADAVAW